VALSTIGTQAPLNKVTSCPHRSTPHARAVTTHHSPLNPARKASDPSQIRDAPPQIGRRPHREQRVHYVLRNCEPVTRVNP
jgi:hypothetical protein